MAIISERISSMSSTHWIITVIHSPSLSFSPPLSLPFLTSPLLPSPIQLTTTVYYLAQSCTIWHNLVALCNIWRHPAPYSTIWHHFALSRTIWHYSVLCCTIWNHPTLPRSIMHHMSTIWLALACTFLHYLVPSLIFLIQLAQSWNK